MRPCRLIVRNPEIIEERPIDHPSLSAHPPAHSLGNQHGPSLGKGVFLVLLWITVKVSFLFRSQ
jgi:hypothetical protein